MKKIVIISILSFFILGVIFIILIINVGMDKRDCRLQVVNKSNRYIFCYITSTDIIPNIEQISDVELNKIILKHIKENGFHPFAIEPKGYTNHCDTYTSNTTFYLYVADYIKVLSEDSAKIFKELQISKYEYSDLKKNNWEIVIK